jgi:hypothetical protein
MKLKMLILFLCVYTAISAQCDKDRKVWAPSIVLTPTNNIGIGGEIGHLAEVSRISYIIGGMVYSVKYIEYAVIDSKEVTVNRRRVALGGFVNISYKLIQKDYKYSVHIVGGGRMDDGEFNPHIGMRVQKPLGFKSIFIQSLYVINKGLSAHIGIYLGL